VQISTIADDLLHFTVFHCFAFIGVQLFCVYYHVDLKHFFIILYYEVFLDHCIYSPCTYPPVLFFDLESRSIFLDFFSVVLSTRICKQFFGLYQHFVF
jgi:hypothetical protein